MGVSDHAVNVVLISERDGGSNPIYYVRKNLIDVEKRYLKLDKLALALAVIVRKMRPYFQGHSIIVRTSYPLKNMLQKPDMSGRMTKWSVELEDFNIFWRCGHLLRLKL